MSKFDEENVVKPHHVFGTPYDGEPEDEEIVKVGIDAFFRKDSINNGEMNTAFKTKWERANRHRSRFNRIFDEIATYVRGDQYKHDDRNKAIYKNSINKLGSNVEYRLNNFMFKKVDVGFMPFSSKHIVETEKFEQLFNGLSKHWKWLEAIQAAVSNAFTTLYGATLCTYDGSLIRFLADGTEKNGSIVFKDINPTELYWDPFATSMQDASYVVWNRVVTLKRLLSSDDIVSYDGGVGLDILKKVFAHWENITYEDAVDILASEENYTEEDSPTDDTKLALRVFYTKEFERVTGKDGKDKAIVKVFETWVIGNQLVVYRQDTGLTMLPISIMGERWDSHSFVPRPSVKDGISVQKDMDTLGALQVQGTLAHAFPTYTVNTQAGISAIDIQKIGLPGRKIRYDSTKLGNGTPVNILPINVEVRQLQESYKDRNEQLIEVMGNSKFTVGDTGSVNSNAGLQAATSMSMARDGTPLRNAKKYIRRLVKIAIEYLQDRYIEKDFEIEIISPVTGLGTFEKIKFDTSTINKIVSAIEINVETLATLSTKRDLMLQLTTLSSQTGMNFITPQQLIKSLNITDKEVRKMLMQLNMESEEQMTAQLKMVLEYETRLQQRAAEQGQQVNLTPDQKVAGIKAMIKEHQEEILKNRMSVKGSSNNATGTN